jgi:rhodanese-related sulfurtransferase
MEETMSEELTPQELSAELERREPIVLLDVRERWETALCRLDHAVHIPLEEIEVRVDELQPDDDTVVYCHHGVRSAAVVEYLRQLGFARVRNLRGGIDAWARAVDRSMRRY